MRRRAWFSLRVRVALVARVARRLVPWLVAVLVYLVVAALVVRADQRRHGESTGDFQATLYGLFTQLFFQPTAAFPGSAVARAVFWLTPFVGLALVTRGLFAVGASLFDERARRALWVSVVSEQLRDHVVVCGLGHVGYRVVQELHRIGEPLVALERDEQKSFVEEVRALGLPVHVGDARRDEVLEMTGIARARAVVCATNDDLANLEIALDAKRMNPNIRVVMRMFDQKLAAKVGSALELDEFFSTSAVSAPLVALRATEEGVLSAYRVGDALRVTAEVTIGAAHQGKSIADLEAHAHCRIVARLREKGGREAIEVHDAERVATGDRLVVDIAAGALASVRRRLA